MGKKCTKCGGGGPFHKDGSRPDGLTSQCKSCRNAHRREIYYQNPEAERERNRLWARNRYNSGDCCSECGSTEFYLDGHCIECKRRYNKKYIRENRERNKERCRQWYRENKEYARRKNREWREQNLERKREADRQYYLRVRHTERYKRQAVKRTRRWQKRYPVKHRTIMRRRWAREHGAEGDHTADEFKRLCKQYDNRCLRCGRGDVKLTADHVIPLSRGGSNYISNIQPLCGPCNSSKHDKIVDYRKKPLPKRWIQEPLPLFSEEQKA